MRAARAAEEFGHHAARGTKNVPQRRLFRSLRDRFRRIRGDLRGRSFERKLRGVARGAQPRESI